MFIKLQFSISKMFRPVDFEDTTDITENMRPVAVLTVHVNLALQHDRFRSPQFYRPHGWYLADVQ